jgi:aromatic ring hydroxylase
MAGDNVDFTITGKDFVTSMNYEVYLYNSDYDENITAEDIDVKSATSIKGTFDLDNDANVDTYQLCIKDGFGGIECKKNAFKITTNEVGSIEISSSPTGATIYINDVTNGTTPRTIDDLIVGSYKITLKKSGYQDWAKTVKVEEDDTTEVDATLYAAATTTPTPIRTTTQATPRPTTASTAIRTTAEKTVRIPTTLADTPSPTEESPADPALIIGTICLAFIALRKH